MKCRQPGSSGHFWLEEEKNWKWRSEGATTKPSRLQAAILPGGVVGPVVDCRVELTHTTAVAARRCGDTGRVASSNVHTACPAAAPPSPNRAGGLVVQSCSSCVCSRWMVGHPDRGTAGCCRAAARRRRPGRPSSWVRNAADRVGACGFHQELGQGQGHGSCTMWQLLCLATTVGVGRRPARAAPPSHPVHSGQHRVGGRRRGCWEVMAPAGLLEPRSTAGLAEALGREIAGAVTARPGCGRTAQAPGLPHEHVRALAAVTCVGGWMGRKPNPHRSGPQVVTTATGGRGPGAGGGGEERGGCYTCRTGGGLALVCCGS